MRRLEREEMGMCRLWPLELSERAWLCSFQCFLYICEVRVRLRGIDYWDADGIEGIYTKLQKVAMTFQDFS